MVVTPNLNELKDACGSEDLSDAFKFLFSQEMTEDEGFLIRTGEECNQLRAKIEKREHNITETKTFGTFHDAATKAWDCLVETQEREEQRLRALTTNFFSLSMEGQSSHASINPNISANTSSDVGTGMKCASGDIAWEWGVLKDPTKRGTVWCTLCDKRMSGAITSGDIAWEWGVLKDPTKRGTVWCTLCDKRMSGAITRLKQHLTHTKGDVTGCPKVTTEITKRVLASMQEKDKVTKEKKRNLEILRSSNMIDLSEDEDEDVDDEVQVKRKESKKRKFVGPSNVRGPLDSILKSDHQKTNQSTLDKNNPIKQKLKMVAWKKFATWAYAVGLPFNAVRDESFQDMINAIGDYGKCMPAPSYHNLRATLLKDALEDTKKLKRRFESIKTNKSLDPILLRDVEENDEWTIPMETELQDFVDAGDGLLWSDVREAMGGNENIGPSTRSKREHYRDDDDEISIEEDDLGLGGNLDEEVNALDDVDSDAEPVDCT
ncbi:zinc finger protein [Artemisia annua]|uniref:Zinc finger protein n=1 Tax=Artemisia annua TaxID=35608 RepID=A0A2U1Q2M1_ARTAN|nr:zinc finger protein [Artemisia annua]